jgi:arylsulfatase A-like enzyme
MRDEQVIQQQPDQAALTERYVEKSVRFIRENAERPFFLYLAHMYVHLPIYAPGNFLRESRNGRYGAGVACVDWATGVILHELEALGLDEDTLVIFTSDNGSRCRGEGGSNGVLRGTKGTTWEGGQRVPCIMRWPHTIPGGKVCRELVTAMDFCPTLAELAGIGVPQDRIIDGKSILPLMLSAADAESPHEAFFYYIENDLEAVRDKTWKLHVRKAGKEVKELYNLERDPGETQNLYASYPSVVKDLMARMDACRMDIGDAANNVPGRNVRAAGRVDTPKTLTRYDPEHPYLIAMYDLKDRG